MWGLKLPHMDGEPSHTLWPEDQKDFERWKKVVLTFEVPGRPQGKGRPRAYTSGGHTRMYTPDKTVTYENWIRLCYQRAYPAYPRVWLSAPVTLEVDAYFAVPKSYSKARAAACRANETRPTAKPDADNILKAVCDALNGTAYHDDSEIAEMHIAKRYGTQERLVVRLTGQL